MMKRLKFLKSFYILLLALNVGLIIFTPYLVTRGLPFAEEETVEVLLIALLSLVAYIIYSLYSWEIKKQDQDLADLFKHIGQLNVQIQEIKDFFSKIDHYPENKKDIEQVFQYSANKILAVINVDWVMIKIVDLLNFNTLKECLQGRKNLPLPKIQINNKDLLKNDLKNYITIKSDQENLSLASFCVLPKVPISSEQKIIVKTINSQLEMLFIIFTSLYYKDNRLNNFKK